MILLEDDIDEEIERSDIDDLSIGVLNYKLEDKNAEVSKEIVSESDEESIDTNPFALYNNKELQDAEEAALWVEKKFVELNIDKINDSASKITDLENKVCHLKKNLHDIHKYVLPNPKMIAAKKERAEMRRMERQLNKEEKKMIIKERKQAKREAKREYMRKRRNELKAAIETLLSSSDSSDSINSSDDDDDDVVDDDSKDDEYVSNRITLGYGIKERFNTVKRTSIVNTLQKKVERVSKTNHKISKSKQEQKSLELDTAVGLGVSFDNDVIQSNVNTKEKIRKFSILKMKDINL